MTEQTALEVKSLVVSGDRSALRLESGTIVLHKDATTQVTPTEVTFPVERIRGATLQAPTRGEPGWLHVAVVGGSPPPPGGLAAASDPYTLPLTGRAPASARRFVRMVERHVRARGLPPDAPGTGSRVSTGIVLNPGGQLSPKHPYGAGVPVVAAETAAGDPVTTAPAPAPVPEPDRDVVARLRELAELRKAGALTADEFERAKARVLEERT